VKSDAAGRIFKVKTVLLALDDTDESHFAALTATTLFGPDTEYLAVHVEQSVRLGRNLVGPVYGYPYPVLPTDVPGDAETRRAAVERARATAKELADEAGVRATPLGDVGDPAHAIRDLAEEHGADVVVVGDHQRGWFRRLLDISVTAELLRTAGVPILVVPMAEDD
jgi:nucleotide-binding universal stress UspA family protein